MQIIYVPDFDAPWFSTRLEEILIDWGLPVIADPDAPIGDGDPAAPSDDDGPVIGGGSEDPAGEPKPQEDDAIPPPQPADDPAADDPDDDDGPVIGGAPDISGVATPWHVDPSQGVPANPWTYYTKYGDVTAQGSLLSRRVEVELEELGLRRGTPVADDPADAYADTVYKKLFVRAPGPDDEPWLPAPSIIPGPSSEWAPIWILIRRAIGVYVGRPYNKPLISKKKPAAKGKGKRRPEGVVTLPDDDEVTITPVPAGAVAPGAQERVSRSEAIRRAGSTKSPTPGAFWIWQYGVSLRQAVYMAYGARAMPETNDSTLAQYEVSAHPWNAESIERDTYIPGAKFKIKPKPGDYVWFPATMRSI